MCTLQRVSGVLRRLNRRRGKQGEKRTAIHTSTVEICPLLLTRNANLYALSLRSALDAAW